jgi:Transcriptional regulators containing a DNA-binding HTH domain and an aminotransferase domain (MocR family) and their eukaryotic orthologs
MQLALVLDGDSSTPLYRQLCEAVKKAIYDGLLRPGDALPSTRELSDSLGLSRFTIRRGYEELASQGFVEPSRGAGTFVSKTLPARTEEARKAARVVIDDLIPLPRSAYSEKVNEVQQRVSARSDLFVELNYGMPTTEDLPLALWRQLLLRHCRFADKTMLEYLGDPLGYEPLREALSGYISRARGIRCSADQIAIFSGSQHALDLLCRVLFDAGEHVAMEEPGYPGARRTFMSHGAIVHPVPVDSQGLSVEALSAMDVPIKVVYTTPSHQDPTSVAMSVSRRQELLKWARKNGAVIVEDDNDSEYRYGSGTVPALQGLDEGDCVVYLSTFWKTLGPVVVLGFIVLPQRLLMRFTLAKSMVERDFPTLEQAALADFINEGHFERHIRRTKQVYAKRRQTLVFHLTKALRNNIEISKETAGMQLLARFPEVNGISEARVIEAAERANLSIMSTFAYYMGESPTGEFVIPFAHLSEAEIERRVELFAQTLMASHSV